MTMRYGENELGNDYAVGDIHGNYSGLMNKLHDIGFDFGKDRLFSVGDLIDRGAESEKCLMLIDKSWFYAVRENHEQMMIESVKTRNPSITSCWIMNGGTWSLDCDEYELACFAEMADSLPWLIEVGAGSHVVGVLHAESLKVWQENYRHNQDAIIWGRDKITSKDKTPVDGIDYVVVGHTPLKSLQVLGNVYYIDTLGWHESGYLTVLDLKTMLPV